MYTEKVRKISTYKYNKTCYQETFHAFYQTL